MGLTSCSECRSINVFLTTRFTLANWPYAWICGDCGASVGCQSDTDLPLGLMATGSLRKLRRLAHISFDKIWQAGFMTRDRAIEWMGKELDMIERFHISTSTHKELLRCITISEEYCRRKGQHKIEIGKQRINDRHKRTVQRLAKHNLLHASKRKHSRNQHSPTRPRD